MSKNKIFLLLGTEEGEKIQYLRKYIQTIQEKEGEEPEVLRYYPFESNLVDIVAILRNKSLFAGHTVVILYNIEEIKKHEELKILQDYLEHPSESSTLFLLSSSIQQVSKKITSNVPPKNKIIFWELFDTQKRGWIKNYFQSKNITIEMSALEFILEMVENNTKDLKSECSKLALFFGPKTEIKTEELEKYLYHSKEENVFTLFESIALKNFDLSLEILSKIKHSGEYDAVSLLSGLIWQARKLHSFKLMLNKNYHNSEAFKNLNITSKKNQKIYIEAHKNYTEEDVAAIILLFLDFDVEVRSLKTEAQEIFMQLLIYYIVEKHGKRVNTNEIVFY